MSQTLIVMFAISWEDYILGLVQSMSRTMRYLKSLSTVYAESFFLVVRLLDDFLKKVGFLFTTCCQNT